MDVDSGDEQSLFSHINKSRFYIFVCSLSLGSLIIGFSIGALNPFFSMIIYILELKKDKYDMHYSMATIMLPIGALLASIFTGIMGNYPRRVLIYIADAIIILGSLLLIVCPFNRGLTVLCVGRSLVGFGVGILFLIIPTYLRETFSVEIIATSGSIHEFSIVFGIFLSMSISYLFTTFGGKTDGIPMADYDNIPGKISTILSLWWDFIHCFPALIAALQIAVLYFYLHLEPPRYLYFNDKKEKSIETLNWFYEDNQQMVQSEFMTYKKMKVLDPTWHGLISMEYSKSISMGIILCIFVPLGLMPVFLNYSSAMLYHICHITMLNNDNSSCDFDTQKSFNLFTFIMFLCTMVCAFLPIFYVKYLPRRALLITGAILCGLNDWFVGIFIANEKFNEIVIFSCIFLMCYHLTFSPIFSTYLSEILPLKGRCICITIYWMVYIALGISILKLGKSLEYDGIFWLGSSFIGLFSLFSIFILPETKGKQVNDVLALFDSEYISIKKDVFQSSESHIKLNPSTISQ